MSIVFAVGVGVGVIGARVTSTYSENKSNQDVFYAQMIDHLRRLNRSVNIGDIVFLGDSHIQGMNVADVSSRGVNFGIGGDTSSSLLRRTKEYDSLKRAGGVVIAIGFNDLKKRSVQEIAVNINQILNSDLPPAILSAIPPVNLDLRRDLDPNLNAKIALLNDALRRTCVGACRFIPPSVFATDSRGNVVDHEGDGVHLNAKGYKAWTVALKSALLELNGQAKP